MINPEAEIIHDMLTLSYTQVSALQIHLKTSDCF